MTHALYRKWRPQQWDEVVGQDHVIRTLRNALKGGRHVHAYLFAGPRGTGKTTTARLLAKALNCTGETAGERPCGVCANCLAVAEGRYLDLIEIDAASNTSVDDVRDLRDRINFAPNEGRYKVYIIDEVHMLSTAAFNALLKTLEEPPEHAIFVLATTEIHKIPATVLSRCQRHEFRRLPVATMVDHLQAQLTEEGIEVERPALELIARQATGSLRDAISLLDQLASSGETVTLEQTETVLGTAASEAVRAVVASLADRDVGQGLSMIHKALDQGADARQFGRQVVDFLRAVLLAQMGNPELIEAAADARVEIEALAAKLSTHQVLRAIKAFGQAASDRRSSWLAALPLEIALVEAAETVQEMPGPPEEKNPARTQQIREHPAPSGQTPEDTAAGQAASPQPASPPPGAEADREPDPPQPATPKSETREGGITFEIVVSGWRDILQAARKRDPRVQALLNSCRPLGLEKGSLLIGFRSDLLREKMEKEHNLTVAASALEEVTGAKLGLRCLLSESWQNGDVSPEENPLPMEDDGMVATAIRELGAQVVDVEQWPPEARTPGGGPQA